jgi:anti-sigma regulatory factor (Ser/Thr protein kinase)
MDFIESQLIEDGVGNQDKTNILTACEEVIVNIVNYAYGDTAGELKIEYERKPDRIILTFIDGGLAFNPLEAPEVDTDLPLEERNVGGLGIFMVKNMMDNVEYEYKERKNNRSDTT